MTITLHQPANLPRITWVLEIQTSVLNTQELHLLNSTPSPVCLQSNSQHGECDLIWKESLLI